MPELQCAYCDNFITETDVPDIDDEEMWKYLAEEHAPDCEWIITRAHRKED